jgi:hypothetical protein
MSDILQRLLTDTWPAKMARSAFEALMLPGQVAGGQTEVKPTVPGMWSDVDEARQQATANQIESRAKDLGGLLMGGGYPMAQPGAAGIFGGRLAKTADQAALSKAEEMAAKGSPREQIWNDTGWFQGVDGKWRFEIDDSASKFLGMPPRDSLTTTDKVLSHQQLYDAYPATAKIEADTGPLAAGNASFNRPVDKDDAGRLRFSTLFKGDPRSVTLHEMQHGVQGAEGFASGANALFLKPGTPAWGIYQERLKAMKTPLDRATYSKVAGYGDDLASEAEYKKYLKIIKKPDRMSDRAAQDYAVQSAYKRTAGEVEARNVQTRMDMTPDQRRATPPWSTQDVDDAMQFVKF